MNKEIKEKIVKIFEIILGLSFVIPMIAFIAVAVMQNIKIDREIKEDNAAMVQRYELSTNGMALCDKDNLLSQEDAVWSGNRRELWNHNLLALKSKFDFVVVEQNLPLPVTGTGYDAVMPKDNPRYKVINEVFDYVGDLMGRKFIVVDDRKEILGDMTADMADKVPVWELYLAIDEGRYMGYPVVAWGDQIGGVLGVEVWWWYDDNMWKEGGYYTLLHEIGHMLGLGHVDESAGYESVMGGIHKSTSQMMATRTFGSHDLAGLKNLWCTNPVK